MPNATPPNELTDSDRADVLAYATANFNYLCERAQSQIEAVRRLLDRTDMGATWIEGDNGIHTVAFLQKTVRVRASPVFADEFTVCMVCDVLDAKAMPAKTYPWFYVRRQGIYLGSPADDEATKCDGWSLVSRLLWPLLDKPIPSNLGGGQ